MDSLILWSKESLTDLRNPLMDSLVIKVLSDSLGAPVTRTPYGTRTP